MPHYKRPLDGDIANLLYSNRRVVTLHVAESVVKEIDALPGSESSRIYAHLDALKAEEIKGLIIKTIAGKIKELVIRQYRIIFFRMGDAIHVRAMFKKQSKKTPRHIIEKVVKEYQVFHHETL